MAYVYLHLRATGPRAGSVFYVGKGSGRRAWSKCGRNKHWKSTAGKYGFEVTLVADDLDEDVAFELEKELIAELREHLCNFDEGGKGATGGCYHYMYGKSHSSETRKLMSETHKGRSPSEEHRLKLSKALKGRAGSMLGRAGPDHPMHGRKHTMETRGRMSVTRRALNPEPTIRQLKKRLRRQQLQAQL